MPLLPAAATMLNLHEFAGRGRYVALLEELKADELLLVDVAL